MTETARVYRCGECGGPNSETDRYCSFCRVAIATLRCAHCYHLNVPDNRNCSACGEVLGLVTTSVVTDVCCPECGGPCEAFEGDPGLLYDCELCRGQFVEHALLHDLLERKRRFARPGPLPRANPLRYQVRYVRCPICKELMLRRNFGGTSGIIVDHCSAHGVWFNHGELTRVLAYVEAGGLADARRHRLGLPLPVGGAQQVAVARAVAASMNEQRELEGGRADTPSAATNVPRGAAVDVVMDVAVGVTESALDLLALIGEFVMGDKR